MSHIPVDEYDDLSPAEREARFLAAAQREGENHVRARERAMAGGIPPVNPNLMLKPERRIELLKIAGVSDEECIKALRKQGLTIKKISAVTELPPEHVRAVVGERKRSADVKANKAEAFSPAESLPDGVYDNRDIICSGVKFQSVPQLERRIFAFMLKKQRCTLDELSRAVWDKKYTSQHRQKIQARVSMLNQRIERSGVRFSLPRGENFVERKHDNPVTPQSP